MSNDIHDVYTTESQCNRIQCSPGEGITGDATDPPRDHQWHGHGSNVGIGYIQTLVVHVHYIILCVTLEIAIISMYARMYIYIHVHMHLCVHTYNTALYL